MGLFGGKPKQPAQPGVPGMPPAAPPPKASGAPIPPRFQNVADTMAAGSFSLKDIIAPSYIEVDFNHIKIDDRYYRSLFVTGYPRYVAANWLYSLITYDHPLYVTMFIYPTESKQVLDQLKKKIAEMQATIESDIKAGKVVSA
jgi:hypothetical protein